MSVATAEIRKLCWCHIWPQQEGVFRCKVIDIYHSYRIGPLKPLLNMYVAPAVFRTPDKGLDLYNAVIGLAASISTNSIFIYQEKLCLREHIKFRSMRPFLAAEWYVRVFPEIPMICARTVSCYNCPYWRGRVARFFDLSFFHETPNCYLNSFVLKNLPRCSQLRCVSSAYYLHWW